MLFIMRFDLRNPSFSGVSTQERYEAALEMTEWADRHGGLAVSFQEHHDSDDGYLPSPLVMAGAVGARTQNIAIGIAALVAPFYDPIRLAEDTAVVDQLCGGRLNLIIGGGYVPEEFAHFGVPMNKRPSLVRETVETLRAAWTGEPFEFRGRTVRVRPTPAQEGGPEIILGGSSEPAARRAAHIGDGFVPSEAGVWEHYRDECLRLGKDDPGEGFDVTPSVVMLAEDPEAAWAELGPYFLHEANSYGRLQEAGGFTAYHSFADLDELRADGMYRILAPDDYEKELADEGEMAVVRLHPMVGGIPPALAWRHLELFEEHFLS
ncbi:MAG: LLM class flavin-dependent oxidoreductase [Acidimicrobiales bacterium]|nr:LLM class flavin-dependent oxidoreductase [Acidimicrobiales bacterium]